MVPNDDEIINWSINESEIIDPELWMSDDVVDVNWVEDIENIDESENNIDVDENGGENVDVEFEVID